MERESAPECVPHPLTTRVGNLEARVARLRNDVTEVSIRHDHVNERLDRIERRLGMVDPSSTPPGAPRNSSSPGPAARCRQDADPPRSPIKANDSGSGQGR